MIVLIAFYVTR